MRRINPSESYLDNKPGRICFAWTAYIDVETRDVKAKLNIKPKNWRSEEAGLVESPAAELRQDEFGKEHATETRSR